MYGQTEARLNLGRAQKLALLLFPHELCLKVLFAKVFRLINVIDIRKREVDLVQSV